MESRVESLEMEVGAVKEGIETLGSSMKDMTGRMEKVETSMETIREYLRELRESVVDKEGNDRRQTPRGLDLSPSYSPPTKDNSATPQGRAEDVMEEVGEMAVENRRDWQYRRLELPCSMERGLSTRCRRSSGTFRSTS